LKIVEVRVSAGMQECAHCGPCCHRTRETVFKQTATYTSITATMCQVTLQAIPVRTRCIHANNSDTNKWCTWNLLFRY